MRVYVSPLTIVGIGFNERCPLARSNQSAREYIIIVVIITMHPSITKTLEQKLLALIIIAS